MIDVALDAIAYATKSSEGGTVLWFQGTAKPLAVKERPDTVREKCHVARLEEQSTLLLKLVEAVRATG